MIERFSSKLLFLIGLPIIIFASVPTNKLANQDSLTTEKKVPWYISDIAHDGSWMILSDETRYEISPSDWQVVRLWSDRRTHPGDVKVVNTKNNNLDYPIDIYNKHTGQTVQTRLPLVIEEAPTAEAPSEDNESD